MNIDDLMAVMQQQAEQEAAMAGYDEQRARAEALRGTDYSKLGSQMGNVGGSYVGLLADLVAGSKGRQIDREIRQPRQDTRKGLAQAKAQAQAWLAKRKFDTEERDYQFDQDKFAYEQGQDAQARADEMAKRSAVDVVRKADDQQMILHHDGRGNYFDGAGNRVNIDDYHTYFKPSAGRGGRGLTGSGMRGGLEKLGKRLDVIVPVFRQAQNIDEALAPFAVGGEQEGEDVPGMGYLEGARGPIGSAVRFAGTQQGREVFQNVSSFVSNVLKQQAGTAQTLTETRNILMGLGLDSAVDEGVFLKHWPKIRTALQQDLERIKTTTHPDVMAEHYKISAGAPTAFEMTLSDRTFATPEKGTTGVEVLTGANKEKPADPYAGFSIVEE